MSLHFVHDCVGYPMRVQAPTLYNLACHSGARSLSLSKGRSDRIHKNLKTSVMNRGLILFMGVPAHICVVGLYLTATPFASFRPKESQSLTQRRLSNYFFGCILRSLHLIYDHFQSNMCWIDLHSRALSFHLPTISFHHNYLSQNKQQVHKQ